MGETFSRPLKPTDRSTFSGTAFSGLLAAAEAEEFIKLYLVRFEPGARTFWHAHSGPQILVVTEGTCRYQREGEPIRDAAAGESVRFEPGVRHWHGAGSDSPAEHVAINLDVRETEWLEEAKV